MAFLNLFKDWVFLIEPGRSFHNLGAVAWKDQSPSVVSVLPLQGARSKPSLEWKSYLPVSLTELNQLTYVGWGKTMYCFKSNYDNFKNYAIFNSAKLVSLTPKIIH